MTKQEILTVMNAARKTGVADTLIDFFAHFHTTWLFVSHCLHKSRIY